MANLDPYPWVSPTSDDMRWGREYPMYDGMPLTYLNLVFKPRKEFSQDQSEYPVSDWTDSELDFARGYYEGVENTRSLYEDYDD